MIAEYSFTYTYYHMEINFYLQNEWVVLIQSHCQRIYPSQQYQLQGQEPCLLVLR